MAYAGTIRGAIAFGLSVSVNTGNKALDDMISTGTLSIVIFTIVVFGIFLPLIITFYKSLENTKTLEELKEENDNKKSLLESQEKLQKQKFALKRRGTKMLISFEDAFNSDFSYMHPNHIQEDENQ
jgi:NhaP-type Na+/H+ or K+/H+ antiporter